MRKLQEMDLFFIFVFLMKRKFHAYISFVVLVVVLFMAIPKVYIHKLMGHNHISQAYSHQSEPNFNKDNQNRNCDLEKFETPVYFTFFKIILNCSPFKQSEQLVRNHYSEQIPNNKSITLSQLRAPPVV